MPTRKKGRGRGKKGCTLEDWVRLACLQVYAAALGLSPSQTKSGSFGGYLPDFRHIM